jgi:hypothetical protein
MVLIDRLLIPLHFRRLKKKVFRGQCPGSGAFLNPWILDPE